MTLSKKILIIAGPNGAGKTTFATEFLPNEGDCPTFINADLIAAGLNPFQPEMSAFRAGRLMLEMIDDYVSRGESFSFEITLSGRGFARMIPMWQEQGYWVKLYFLRLPSADMAIVRVQNRVHEGGHNIPEKDIRRRFDAGWYNFQTLYKGLVNDWILCDTTGGSPVILERDMGATVREPGDSEQSSSCRNNDSPAVLTTLRRAAFKARHKAIETTGSVPTWRDGQIAYDTEE